MLVKCKGCGQKIDRDKAYKMVINEKNNYYCNETEYNNIILTQKIRNGILETINDIFGYKIINTLLYKELKEVYQVYTYSLVYDYLIENKVKLSKLMNKDFNNEYGRIRYFSTILKNNLNDFKQFEKFEDIKNSSNIETVEIKYTPIKRKKSLSDYINEME